MAFTCVSNGAQKLERRSILSLQNEINVAIDTGLKVNAGICGVFWMPTSYLHLLLHVLTETHKIVAAKQLEHPNNCCFWFQLRLISRNAPQKCRPDQNMKTHQATLLPRPTHHQAPHLVTLAGLPLHLPTTYLNHCRDGRCLCVIDKLQRDPRY